MYDKEIGKLMIKLPEADVFFHKQKNISNWGAEEFSILQPHLKNFRTCLDIGAHVGITTLRYAQHFKTVHSFEPIHYGLLAENTKDLNNVVVHGCAVSNEAGTVEMYPNLWNSGGGIIPDEYNMYFIDKRYEGENAAYKDVKKISVNCLPIDDFNYEDVDLIKIDVEGYILPVLEGLIKTLTTNSSVVQIEMSAFENVNEQAHNIFTDLGYNSFSKYGKHDVFYEKG